MDVASANRHGRRPSHVALVSFGYDFGMSSAGFRAWKFAKYLGRAGMRVTMVLPVDRGGGGQPDGTMTSHFANVEMAGYVVPWGFGSANKLVRVAHRSLCYPEPHRRCLRRAMGCLSRVGASDQIDAIVVTTPPHSMQLLGIRAAEQMGLPYVADLRDDWLTNHRHRWHTPMHRRSALYWERRMMETATSVILNTGVVHDRFASRYPEYANRIAVLTNGYDEDDFATSPDCVALPSGKKLLMYCGDPYGRFMTDMLGDLAADMKLSGLDSRWHIVTAGSGDWPPLEHASMWTHLGVLENSTLCPLLKKASMLLLGMPPGERAPSGTVPLKTYNYLRAGSPIVYIGETGATTEILAGFDRTYHLERNQWDELAAWVSTHDDELVVSGAIRQGVESYGFAALTQQLMSLLPLCARNRR